MLSTLQSAAQLTVKSALAGVLMITVATSVARAQVPANDTDKTFYALGAEIGKSVKIFNLSDAELKLVILGLTEQVGGKANPEFTSFAAKIRDLVEERRKAQGAEEAKKGEAFLAEEAAKPGVTKTESGLVLTQLVEGTGANPKATDKVKVHYRGTLINGEEFDSSYKRGEPAEFPLNRVIPCWTEGVQLIKVGGKARLVCPSKIAYGERGTPGIPSNSTLIFEVELLDIVADPAPAPAPAPVKVEPAAEPAKAAPAAEPAKAAPAAEPAKAAPAAEPAKADDHAGHNH
jgi:FKBP-type peptidyl-prolyl cis-trans isomerase FkpA